MTQQLSNKSLDEDWDELRARVLALPERGFTMLSCIPPSQPMIRPMDSVPTLPPYFNKIWKDDVSE